MSDPNDKAASILLKKGGKTDAVFLYDFAQFSGQKEDAGSYRVKINGKWHCPDGKYTALSADAVASIVRDWLTSKEPPAQRPEGLDRPARVFAHWEDDGEGTGCGTVWTKTPPHLGSDGRWWIWVDGPRLVRCDDVCKLTRQEARKWHIWGRASCTRKGEHVKAVEMKLGIIGAPIADVNVSMEINLAAMLEDPERSFPAVAKRLGEHLVEAFRLANPDMPEDDTK